MPTYYYFCSDCTLDRRFRLHGERLEYQGSSFAAYHEEDTCARCAQHVDPITQAVIDPAAVMSALARQLRADFFAASYIQAHRELAGPEFIDCSHVGCSPDGGPVCFGCHCPQDTSGAVPGIISAEVMIQYQRAGRELAEDDFKSGRCCCCNASAVGRGVRSALNPVASTSTPEARRTTSACWGKTQAGGEQTNR